MIIFTLFSVKDGGNENFCMNQLKFYGMDSHKTSADNEIPFSTCSLIDYQYQQPNEEYPGLWLKNNWVYHGWDDPSGQPFDKSLPVRCSLPTTTTIQGINMKVCKPLNYDDNTGTLGENITLKMENKDDYKCTTGNVSPSGGFKPGEYVKINQEEKLGGKSGLYSVLRKFKIK